MNTFSCSKQTGPEIKFLKLQAFFLFKRKNFCFILYNSGSKYKLFSRKIT